MSDITFNRPKSLWEAKNPILGSGQFGFEDETGKVKQGNGTTRWNALPYLDVAPYTLPKPVATATGITQTDVLTQIAQSHDTDAEREGFLPARLSAEALKALLVPRPTGGADGQALVKSGTDVVWGAVGGSGLVPSGDTTGATDQAAITAALATGVARLGAGRFYITGLVMPSNSTLILDDAELYLVSGSNKPIIRNATIGKRAAAGADHDISVIGRGRAYLNGNPAGQTGYSAAGQYWLNQGIVMCGVTRLHLSGFGIVAKKGAVHLLGVAYVTGGNIRFDQTGSTNQDGLDIGPDSFTVRMSGFTGTTQDDFFSFYAKYSTAMIPAGSGYQATDGSGGGNSYDIQISDVVGGGQNENLIRLQAGDGSQLYNVSFRGVTCQGGTLLRLGPTSYSTTAPTQGQFRNIQIDGFTIVGALLVLESPCRGVRIANGQVTGGSGVNPNLIQATAFATDCRAITLENIITTDPSNGQVTALTSVAGAVLDDVQIRNVHIGRGRLLANAGIVTNLRLRQCTVRTASAALISSSVAETGHVSGVTADVFSAGVTAVLAGAAAKLRFSDFPILTTADVTPLATAKGSRVVCDQTKQADGGAGTTAAEWFANGAAWVKAADFGAMTVTRP